MTETSDIIKELPGISFSNFCSDGPEEGTELKVGLLDAVGDVVNVGALLGIIDGILDGNTEGELDVVGFWEGLIEGCSVGADETEGI